MRGSVIKRGNTYTIIYDLPSDPLTGKRKQKTKGGFRTKREANAELAKKIAEIEKGTYLEPSKLKLGEYLLRWFDTHKESLSPTTSRRYEGIINDHLILGLGNILLAKLEPLQIQEFIKNELENGRKDNKKTKGTGLSTSSVNQSIRILHRALAQAVEWQLLNRNPVDSVKKPKPMKKDMYILQEKDITKLLNDIKECYLYLPVYLAIYSGMRLGEILGLTWKDVDLERGLIHVRQASCQVKVGEPQFKTPKTAKSKRSINISQTVIKALKIHKKEQAEWKLKVGEAWQEYNLVCCLQDGSPINPPNLSSYFKRTATRLGMPVTFHGLRHTHASLLLKAGVPAKVVSERLGHSSITVTMDIYSHIMPGMQQEAADKLEDLIKNNG